MTKQSQSKGNHKNVGSSMLRFAPESVQKKVQERRRRKEKEEFQKLQEQRAEEAQQGNFAPRLTP